MRRGRRWITGLLLLLGLHGSLDAQEPMIVPAVTSQEFCTVLMYNAERIIELRAEHSKRFVERNMMFLSERLDNRTEYRLIEALFASPITKEEAWAKWGTPCFKRIDHTPRLKRFLVLELPPSK